MNEEINRRRCGECTACCFLLHVPELKKPINELCTHCEIKGGCKIYDDRPASCGKFECGWYSHTEWPDDLRPDKCGVMIEQLTTTDTLIAYSLEFNAWMKTPMVDMIKKLTTEENRAVVVADGNDKHILLPKHKTAEGVWNELIKEYGVINGKSSLHD